MSGRGRRGTKALRRQGHSPGTPTGNRWTVHRSRQKKKPHNRSCEVLCSRYLSSRAVTRQVLSAYMSLTSVFGMGTGGPSSQSIPTHMDGIQPIFYAKTQTRSNSKEIIPVSKNKTSTRKDGGLCWHYLSSRAVTRQVLSAYMSLTSVFGMGTGGPS